MIGKNWESTFNAKAAGQLAAGSVKFAGNATIGEAKPADVTVPENKAVNEIAKEVYTKLYENFLRETGRFDESASKGKALKALEIMDIKIIKEDLKEEAGLSEEEAEGIIDEIKGLRENDPKAFRDMDEFKKKAPKTAYWMGRPDRLEVVNTLAAMYKEAGMGEDLVKLTEDLKDAQEDILRMKESAEGD